MTALPAGPTTEKERRKEESAKLVRLGEGGRLAVQTLHDQLVVANMMLKARVLPAGINTEAQAWALLQSGAENDLPPLTAARWLYIQPKSNKVEWTAEGCLAQARKSRLVERIRQWEEGEGDKLTAVCEIKRRDQADPIVIHYSVADAKRSGLWGGKPGSNWANYGTEMLAATAQRRCVRKAVPECLGGIGIRGETAGERAAQLGDEVVAEVVAEAPPGPAPPAQPPARDPLLEDVVDAHLAEPKPAAPQPAQGSLLP